MTPIAGKRDPADAGVDSPAFNVSEPYRKYVLGLLLVVGIVNFLDRQILAVLLEAIKEEFSLSDTELGLLGGMAFALFYATAGLPVARLADTFNRRNIIAVAIALWSFMTALCGTATGFLSLFLARVGVGIGEAGGVSPSHSLISDYFPPDRRGTALSVYGTYIPLGVLMGFLIGGWVNQFFGWRSAFLVVGIPGLFLALLLRLTLREPPRGHSENVSDAGRVPTMFAAFGYLLSRPTCRHLLAAVSLYALGAWGSGIWQPSFFMRIHGMESGEVGTWLAFTFGLSGGTGAVLGGWISDRAVRTTGDSRWYLWISGSAVLATIPFVFLVYLWPTPIAAFLFLIIPTTLGHVYLGPAMAMLQGMAGLRRRAMVSALYQFVTSLISMGLGPVIIGYASDTFSALYGHSALRYSILSVVVVANSWAALHFLLAARTVRQDLAAAQAG